MKFPLSITACYLTVQGIAQPAPANAQGKIEIVEPWSVTHLLERHAEFIEEIETIEGFRVQIVTTTDLEEANAAKARFMMHFRDYKSYLDFFSPYYKVRIGDFRTRLEAYKCLMEVRQIYPDAYIVLDMIEVSEL